MHPHKLSPTISGNEQLILIGPISDQFILVACHFLIGTDHKFSIFFYHFFTNYELNAPIP